MPSIVEEEYETEGAEVVVAFSKGELPIVRGLRTYASERLTIAEAMWHLEKHKAKTKEPWGLHSVHVVPRSTLYVPSDTVEPLSLSIHNEWARTVAAVLKPEFKDGRFPIEWNLLHLDGVYAHAFKKKAPTSATALKGDVVKAMIAGNVIAREEDLWLGGSTNITETFVRYLTRAYKNAIRPWQAYLQEEANASDQYVYRSLDNKYINGILGTNMVVFNPDTQVVLAERGTEPEVSLLRRPLSFQA